MALAMNNYIDTLPESKDGEDVLTRLPEPTPVYTRRNKKRFAHLYSAFAAAFRIIDRRERGLPISRRPCCGSKTPDRIGKLDWKRAIDMLIASGAVVKTSGSREGYEFTVSYKVARVALDEMRKRTIRLINAGWPVAFLDDAPLPKLLSQ